MREPRPRLRLTAWLCVLVASATLAPACAMLAAADPGIDDPAARVRTTRLDNGFTVLTLEDRTTPVVSLQLWVRVGSRDETRYTGLAHLFEHLMFKGSKHVGPEAHARLIQARGGQVNAFTTNDFTVYFDDVTPETLPLAIALEGERIANLEVSDETFAREREVVLEERRLRSEDDPDGRAFEALMALAFSAHPYRTPVIGWRSDVEAATAEVALDFFRTFYVPNNMWLVIVGDFDTEQTLARVRDAFGGLAPVEPIPRNPTREPVQRGERRQLVHVDVRSQILAGAWHAPAAGHPDAEALDVASQILSGGRSSRLYRKLVAEGQKALGAEGAYWELADAGLFYAFASVRPDAKVEEVEKLFLAEIARLRDELVSPRELEKAKRQLEVGLVNGLATNHALASRIAQETLLFGRVRPLEARLAAISRVTAADVQRVVRAHLVDENRSIVHVKPAAAKPAAGKPAAGKPS
jgi:zinc protease